MELLPPELQPHTSASDFSRDPSIVASDFSSAVCCSVSSCFRRRSTAREQHSFTFPNAGVAYMQTRIGPGGGGGDLEGGGRVDPPPCQQDSQTYLAPKAPEVFLHNNSPYTVDLVNKGHSAT